MKTRTSCQVRTVREIINNNFDRNAHPIFSSDSMNNFRDTIKKNKEGNLNRSLAELVVLEDTLIKLSNRSNFTSFTRNFNWNLFSLNVDAYKDLDLTTLNTFKNLNFPERPQQTSKLINIMSPDIFIIICEELPPSAL